MIKVSFNYYNVAHRNRRDYQKSKCYTAENVCGTWGNKDFDLTPAQCKTFFEYLRMRYMPAHLGKDCSIKMSKKLNGGYCRYTIFKQLRNLGINPSKYYNEKQSEYWANDKSEIVIGKRGRQLNVLTHEFAHALVQVYLPEFAQWCLDNEPDKFDSIDWSAHGKVFTHVLAELLNEHNSYFDSNKFLDATDSKASTKNKTKILTAQSFVDWLFYSHHKLISNNPVPRWDAKNTKNHGRVYRGRGTRMTVQACLNDDQLPNMEQYKSTHKPKELETSNVFQLVPSFQLSLLPEVA